MGWINEDAPEHEGYLVAVVREEERTADGLHVMRSRWRELSGLVHDEETARRYDGARINVVQVACDCGWRSMRMQAPNGTTWRPHCVGLPRDDEEAFEEGLAHELWSAHVREHGGLELYSSLAGPIASTTRYRRERGRLEQLERYTFAPRRPERVR